MLAVVPRDSAEHALDVVRSERHDAWIVGEIVEGHGRASVETR
jgi:hydrogenase maturation factor